MTETDENTVTDTEETLGVIPGSLEGLPDEGLVNEWPTYDKHLVAETATPAKYRELTGLAVTGNSRSPNRQHFHGGAAQLQGANEDELAGIAFLTEDEVEQSADQFQAQTASGD